jgi:hypothetical protein
MGTEVLDFDIYLIVSLKIYIAEKNAIDEWLQKKHDEGLYVYLPLMEIDHKVDPAVYIEKKNIILNSKLVAIWSDNINVNENFDLGLAWAFRKTIMVINKESQNSLTPTASKFISRWEQNSIPL